MGLTHFPFGVSSFGIPLPAANVPGVINNDEAAFPRRYLFVDGTNGNDANTGFDSGHAKKTVQAAVGIRLPGDAILIAPGHYNEAVTISRYFAGVSSASGGPLWLIGMGPRSSVGIGSTATGGLGMIVHESNVSLINIGVSAESTATRALQVSGSSFRAVGCKIEGPDTSGAAAIIGPGTIAQTSTPLWTWGRCGDLIFEDCEFAWTFDGVRFLGTDFGAATQLAFRRCKFHNCSNASFEEAVGSGGSADVLYRNLEISDCVFDTMEDGTVPAFVVLNDNNANTGIATRNSFPVALLSGTGKNVVSTALHWVCNYHTDGVSGAQPT